MSMHHVYSDKMMGDYYRYIAELCPTSRTNENPKLQAESAYRAGMEHAQELPAVHPVRLGLVLNFSVFYFEIMNEREEGCKMARQAFDEAVAGLDAASEESYRDAALVMQLLRDNLTLWTVESTPVDGLTKPDEKREGKTDNWEADQDNHVTGVPPLSHCSPINVLQTAAFFPF